jgi:NDP-sugar pyrophosphorylase family protein
LTDTLPKSLVSVAGKPFIDYQLELLARQGIERAVLCTGYLGADLKGYVGTGKRFGLEVLYSSDGVQQLGTAGAIRKALPLLGQTFGILYGDVYPLYALLSVPISNMATMAVRAPGRGNVLLDKGRVWDYAHGQGYPYGDAGFSVFNANAFVDHPQLALGDVFSALASFGDLDGYEVTEPGYEIGSREGLARFEHYVLHDRVPG